MEYTWKELADKLGVSVRTVRRSAKKLGVEGALSHRSEGGTVRVFSEVDYGRLKEVSYRPLLPVKVEDDPERGMTEGLTTTLTTALTALEKIAVRLDELDELPEMRTILENVQAEAQRREEDHINLLEAHHEAAEQRAKEQEERRQAELAALRQESREREEKHQEELAALRQDAQTERAHAARREEEQRTRDKAIQEALQPWWKRLFRREKNENE